MAKRYYTTTKTGEEVEVDYELAKQLVASGKKKPEDFQIEESESPEEMRQRAKSEYETDVRNLQNQETVDKYGVLFPRATKSENVPQMLLGGTLDLASAPGRFVAGTVAGAGAKLGGGNFLETAEDVASRPGGDPNLNLGSQIIEGAVKDPFAIPFAMTGGLAAGASKIPQLASAIAKSPKLGGALLHGAAGAMENVIGGAAERYVAPGEKVLDTDAMAWEAGLGSILGGAGKLGGDWLKGFGDTQVGRALIRKITPNKYVAGEADKLAELIQEGFGVDVKTGNKIDSRKLGRFLSEESRGSDILAESKYTRIPEWIEAKQQEVGRDIGRYREASTDAEFDAAGNLRIDSYIPRDTDILSEMRNVKNSFKVGEPKVISFPEIERFEQEITEMLPEKSRTIDPETGAVVREINQMLSPHQLKQLNDFLYNAGKESSLKYHPSKEQYATELRKRISQIQKEIIAEAGGDKRLPSQYSALRDLEELALRSPILNLDRPTFMSGGLMATAGRGIGSVGAKAGELPTGAKRTAKEALQAMIRTPSRTPNRNEQEAIAYRGLAPADQRVFARAQDRLRFDPNDQEARAIISGYMDTSR